MSYYPKQASYCTDEQQSALQYSEENSVVVGNIGHPTFPLLQTNGKQKILQQNFNPIPGHKMLTYMNDDWLRHIFSPFGWITSAKVVPNHSHSPCVAFVQYISPWMASNALLAMNGIYIGEYCLRVKMAFRDKDKGMLSRPSVNVYVSNLPLWMDVCAADKLFSPFGQVISLIILTDKRTNASKGVSLVRFCEIKSAIAAVNTMNGVLLEGHDRPLEVKFAESTDQRQERKNRFVATVNPMCCRNYQPLSAVSSAADEHQSATTSTLPSFPEKHLLQSQELVTSGDGQTIREYD